MQQIRRSTIIDVQEYLLSKTARLSEAWPVWLAGPNLTTIGPELATIGPELTTIGPELATIGPELATIGPELATIGPELATIGPRNKDRTARETALATILDDHYRQVHITHASPKLNSKRPASGAGIGPQNSLDLDVYIKRRFGSETPLSYPVTTSNFYPVTGGGGYNFG